MLPHSPTGPATGVPMWFRCKTSESIIKAQPCRKLETIVCTYNSVGWRFDQSKTNKSIPKSRDDDDRDHDKHIKHKSEIIISIKIIRQGGNKKHGTGGAEIFIPHTVVIFGLRKRGVLVLGLPNSVFD